MARRAPAAALLEPPRGDTAAGKAAGGGAMAGRTTAGEIPLAPDVTNQPPAFRTAQEIARTVIGPRPIPPLAKTGRIRTPALARAVLPTGLQVVAVRKPRSPLVEVRLRIPFGGTSKVHAARAVMLEVLADCLTDPAFRRNDVLGERDRLVAHLSIAANLSRSPSRPRWRTA